ncbi:MAG: retropepsin-like domain-containing protein [Ignavibacteriae bacterium]|nr:retropepsin-like domain-containing protein [Ignavibacteriota bacterium]
MTYRFKSDGKLIIVPVKIFGNESEAMARLAIDTGATRTMLNVHIAVYLGYDPASSRERVQITTGSGVEFTSQIRVRQIETLGIKKLNFPILCHTLPPSAAIDGLLGLDFFNDTVLSIDFRQGILSVNEQLS